MKSPVFSDIMICIPLKINDVSEEYRIIMRTRNQHEGGPAWYWLYAGLLLGLFYDTEYGGDIILRNVG
jgi:hypothetical protein